MWDDKTITARAEAAETSRRMIGSYIERCMEKVAPWRLPGNRGSQAFEQLFDSTGPVNHQRMASRIQRDVTPPFQRFMELEAGPLVPDNVVEQLNRQLEPITKIIHATLDASAYPIASLSAYGDMGISTGALLANEGDDNMPIRWDAAPAWALGIEEGPGGRVDNTFYCRPYPAWILARHWPQAQWSEKTRRLIEAQDTTKIEVRQSTYYDPDLGIWRVAVQELGAHGNPVVWDKARDRTNPWIVFRYWTSSGDPWGRGPVMLALPDMRTANKTVEMVLTAAAYQLAPPLMYAHDGVVNPDTMTLSPRALIRVQRTGGPLGPSIAPLNLGSNVDMAQLALTDMRESITKQLMGAQLPPDSGAVRSASEIIERTKQLQFDAGAAFGRLNHEYIPQVIARVIDLLDRRKVAGIQWDQLKIDHFIMKVKLTSPLARGQNLEDVQVILQFFEAVKAVGGEEAFHYVASQDSWPRIAKLMGVPLWAVNDEAMRAQLADAVGRIAAKTIAGGDAQGNPPPAEALAA